MVPWLVIDATAIFEITDQSSFPFVRKGPSSGGGPKGDTG